MALLTGFRKEPTLLILHANINKNERNKSYKVKQNKKCKNWEELG